MKCKISLLWMCAYSTVNVRQHAEVHPDMYPTRRNITQFIYFWKLLYMFWVAPPPIIRSKHNCIYSMWYLSKRNCYLPLSWKGWNCSSSSSTIAIHQVPDAVDTLVCTPDDGWRCHPKHVEQFPEINKLCNVASCWIYAYIRMYLRCTDPWTLNMLKYYINKIQWDATVCRCLFTAKLLYVFRVSIAPIIRSTSNCNCSFWYRS